MKPTLTVYKASAGSGKTFTLAIEYIRLLILNPQNFRSILAVTFTNKATEEMKMRILYQLYGLSRQLPSSQNFMQALLKSFHENDGCHPEINEDYIAKQAHEALHLLLDNYHFFRVQTIDTFFQGVLRNLARELQLNANMHIGLNNQQVAEEAVDEIIDSLADDHSLKSVVMNYVKENMEADKTWNIIQQIKKFSGTIFKEFYKQNRAELQNKISRDPLFFEKYKEEMRSIINNIGRQYELTGTKAMQLLEHHGLSITDFNYGNSGAIGFFVKLANGRFYDIDMNGKRMQEALNDPDSWERKKSPNRSTVNEVVRNILLPLMRGTCSTLAMDIRTYKSALKTLQHINDVRLLSNIEEATRELNEEAQRFMLSDTQGLLNEMIKDCDSPFIFEKIGAHLQHIMIDEFQDTSTVQWANFKKLLDECMSQGFSNLIVGDVKQSIYRFRNGDWRLLNNIDNMYDDGSLLSKSLDINYRSDRNVIAFNNYFFNIAAKLEAADIHEASCDMAAQLKKAYSDVAQGIPEVKKACGMVHIDLIPKSDRSSMNDRTLDIINELLSKGAHQKDIALLLRGNKEVVSLANHLEKNGLKVVSAEAFKLGASTAVRTIVGAMKYLAHPEDKLTLGLLLKDSGMGALPETFTSNRERLLSLSLHDMAEEILSIFQIVEREGAFITTFFDHLHSFTQDISTTLQDFIEAWNDDICEKAIETPDCDGIRIFTIHKSKGLEFKHVIIPYCNWQLEQRSILWCKPRVNPFDKLPIVPIEYNSANSMNNTIYEVEAKMEHAQNIVDNLNLLYVAMTRAGSSLFIIGERSYENSKGERVIKRDYRSGLIELIISHMQQSINDAMLHIDYPDDHEECITLTYGSIDSIFQQKEERKEDNHTPTEKRNVFSSEIDGSINVDVVSHKSGAVFRQSNKSREFTDDSYDESDQQRYIRLGTVMHQLFSEIRTVDDVLPALQRMEFDGTLYDDGFTKEQLLEKLREKFNNEQVKDWFSAKWTLFNECTIIQQDGKDVRPDRVMTDGKETIVVDFKFGVTKKEHHDQVRNYMNQLTQMEMPDVKGYIWYVSLNRIEEVKA